VSFSTATPVNNSYDIFSDRPKSFLRERNGYVRWPRPGHCGPIDLADRGGHRSGIVLSVRSPSQARFAILCPYPVILNIRPNRRFCGGLTTSATLLLPIRVWAFNNRVACLGTDYCSDARRYSSRHGVSGVCRTRHQSTPSGQFSMSAIA